MNAIILKKFQEQILDHLMLDYPALVKSDAKTRMIDVGCDKDDLFLVEYHLIRGTQIGKFVDDLFGWSSVSDFRITITYINFQNSYCVRFTARY